MASEMFLPAVLAVASLLYDRNCKQACFLMPLLAATVAGRTLSCGVCVESAIRTLALADLRDHVANLREFLPHTVVLLVAKVALSFYPAVSLTRKNLGDIDSTFLTVYMLGQFLFGPLGDRFGPRQILLFGLGLSRGSAWDLACRPRSRRFCCLPCCRVLPRGRAGVIQRRP